MMKTTSTKHLLAIAAVMTMTVPVAQADDDLQEMQALQKSFGFVTLDVAQQAALQAKPGVVKDADLDDRDFGKGWDYEFEIVDADGKEWDVYIDAKTGKVRDVSREWF